MRDTTLGIATDRAKGREVPCFLDPAKNQVSSLEKSWFTY